MINTDYKKLRQAKAIEQKNKQLFLKLNNSLNDNSGIYILFRTDENDIKYFYVGQAKHILSRLSQHMSGYQHIDLSLRKRGLWSDDNPYGWTVFFKNYPEKELDDKEQFWILEMTKRGYQCRYNKTAGGQGEGKEKINEFKPSKGYRDGVQQGRKTMARDLSHIIDKHLVVSVRADKQGNKVSERQFEKFKELLKEGESNED